MNRLLVLLAVLLYTPQVRADSLVVDLSQHLVAITTGFAGTEVLLFGVVDQPSDIVVVVRGPTRPIKMFRKSRIAFIWANTASMTFEQAPSFYAVISSRPLEEIASPSVQRLNGMVIETLRELDLPTAKASPNVAEVWREALIRNQRRLGLYQTEVAKFQFPGGGLFHTRLALPANVPTGEYSVVVFSLVDGQTIKASTTPLIVSKIGVEAEIFDFAHQWSALYGVIAILIALMAGWLAHVAFRRA